MVRSSLTLVTSRSLAIPLTALALCLFGIAPTTGSAAEAPGPPKAVTVAADEVGTDSARLNAVVSSFGAETMTCEFEYGASPSLGSSVPCSEGASGTGQPVSAVATGLAAATTYSFRISFTTGWLGTGGAFESGTATGEIKSFTTLALPSNPSGPEAISTPPLASSPLPGGPQPQRATESKTTVVCVGFGDPPGRHPGCGRDRWPYGFNADELQEAANGVDACVGNGIRDSLIPSGFVVTRMWHKAGCGSDRWPYGYNADELHEAANGVDACVGNKISLTGIPYGFVVTKMWHKPGCGTDRWPYRVNADEIREAANGVAACVGNNISNPGIPGGFVITRMWHKEGCGSDRWPFAFNADEIRQAADGVDACVGNNINPGIPSNFVVTRMWFKDGCGAGRRYGFNADEIREAAVGVVACVGNGIVDRVPAPFVVVRVVMKAGCGATTASYNGLLIGRR
jgi:hypothetical protein